MKASAPTSRPVKRRNWQRWRRMVLIVMLTPLFLLFAAWLALPLVHLPKGLSDAPEPSVELLDRNGRSLRQARAEEGQFHRTIAYAELPQSLIDATLAAEDKRFWQHHGVDWRATFRALWQNARHGRVVSGGSTLTQQLIKLAGGRPRNWSSKLIEAAQALRLEQVWDKQRILAAYLNRIDYGSLNAGCAAAAEHYFAKPLRDLSAAESAFLAGLPQAPSRLNPYRRFEMAKKRQEWILARMETTGALKSEERVRAVNEPLRLAPPARSFRAPHFVDMLLAQANAPFPRGSIRTTLDLELQSFVERTLRDHLGRLSTQHVRDGAVVVIDNRSGDVLALVGSPDYGRRDAGQVNGAWAVRSAGSTLKPFTYLLALERGATAASVVHDLPAEFATATGVFAPVNYNRRCYGPMRYRLALANSLNISAVKVLDSIGGPVALSGRLRAWGLTTLNEAPEHYGLGLTLGNADVRLLELANAYATLARLGEFRPYRLTAAESSRNSHPASRISPHACLIADILADNTARAMAFGLESPLRFDFPVACKTGTSSDYRDNWALGFTPEFTVGIWAGNFDGSPMQGVSGVSGAAPVLHDIFVNLHERFGTTWFARPTNIVERMVHPVTGRMVDTGRSGAVRELFSAVALPEQEHTNDYDGAGRVRLPASYREWLASGDNWIGRGAVVDDTRLSTNRLRVVSPVAGTVFFIDPDLGESGRLIPLRAEGTGALEWACETLSCRAGPGGAWAEMREGRHRLTVRHRESGATAETWVKIKRL